MPSKPTKRGVATAPPAGGLSKWKAVLLLAASLAVLFEIYSPALSGPFLLDDGFQLFGRPEAHRFHLEQWLNNVRPLLNLTYWLNFQLSGQDTVSYHVVNVIFHWLNGILVFVILWRIDRRDWLLSALGAGIFLVHPIQTESVAYISSRSELVSVFFAYAALAVFVTRPPGPIGWGRAAAVIAAFGCAVASKEHTAVLPGVLLLIDLFAGPEAGLKTVRENWRLYAPLAVAAALGMAFVVRTLMSTATAGFGMKGLAWYEYAFTQCRMFWRYLRLLVLPVGLNADPDIPISQSFADPFVVLGLVGIVALAGAAIYYRKRFPLAALGILIFLLFLAPTSSIVPIRDLFAERRVYLPFIGFLLVVMEALGRLGRRNALSLAAGVVLLFSIGTYARAQVWASHLDLWSDTVEKSPNKVRPRFQLAFALYQAGRCVEANQEFSKAASLGKPDALLLIDWALALDCVGQVDEAAARLREAAKIDNSAIVLSTLGMILGKAGRHDEALAALDQAQKDNPRFAMIYVYRGNVLVALQRMEEAAAAFREALKLDPANQGALQGLRVATGK